MGLDVVVELTVQDRLTLAKAAVNKGTFLQGKWRQGDNTCVLGSYGPDINSPNQIPDELAPKWLSHLIVTITDYLLPEKVTPFAATLQENLAKGISALAWDAVKKTFVLSIREMAISSAGSIQPNPLPAYWTKITNLHDGVPALEINRTAAQAGLNRGMGMHAVWTTRPLGQKPTKVEPRQATKRPMKIPFTQEEQFSPSYAARSAARCFLWGKASGNDRVARAFGAYIRAAVGAAGAPGFSKFNNYTPLQLNIFRSNATEQGIAVLWTAINGAS